MTCSSWCASRCDVTSTCLFLLGTLASAPETLSPDITVKRQKSVVDIQRNIRNFRKECHIPLQLTEPSLPESLLSGSAAQWEQIARNTKSDIWDRGGGRRRKLCQALLSHNNLSKHTLTQ